MIAPRPETALPTDSGAPHAVDLQAPGDEERFSNETVIGADSKTRLLQTLRDVWSYRELFRAFLARDLRVRYKQTALGVLWVVFQPLLSGGLLAAIFVRLGLLTEMSGSEAFLFFLAGFIPWNSFARGVQMASSSMESNANLIKKVYFPRLLLPTAYVTGAALDFTVAFGALLLIASLAGAFDPLLVLLAPPLLAVQWMTAAGLGLFFDSLNARYRDVKFAVPFLLQIGMFITVLVSIERWPVALQQLLRSNPMAAVVETYRAILAAKPVDVLLIAEGAAVAALVFFFAVWFFHRREAALVDIL